MDIELLKSSFEAIKPVAKDVVDHFYLDLFRNHPEARELFDSTRMPSQQMALIGSLVFIFDNLEKPEVLKPYLLKMGQRHLDYGVEDHQYQWVAESMINTLKYFFAETWSAELEGSWVEALTFIATTMLEATAKRGPTLKQQIDQALHEALKNSIQSISADREVRKLARETARSMIQEALERELQVLQEKPAVKVKEPKAA